MPLEEQYFLVKLSCNRFNPCYGLVGDIKRAIGWECPGMKIQVTKVKKPRKKK